MLQLPHMTSLKHRNHINFGLLAVFWNCKSRFFRSPNKCNAPGAASVPGSAFNDFVFFVPSEYLFYFQLFVKPWAIDPIRLYGPRTVFRPPRLFRQYFPSFSGARGAGLTT